MRRCARESVVGSTEVAHDRTLTVHTGFRLGLARLHDRVEVMVDQLESRPLGAHSAAGMELVSLAPLTLVAA